MTRRVLLLGVLPSVLDEARRQLDFPDVEFLGRNDLAAVRSALAEADLDHVIMGGGLDLDTRIHVVQEVFRSSDRATVHMKDQMSGPEGFLPFVQAVLVGMKDYQPQMSPNAILRGHQPGADTRG
jgi:hypothetical protein